MTSSRPSVLKELLFDFPNDAGIHLISRSNKSFGDGDSDEEAYSKQFDVDEDYINCVCAGLTSWCRDCTPGFGDWMWNGCFFECISAQQYISGVSDN